MKRFIILCGLQGIIAVIGWKIGCGIKTNPTGRSESKSQKTASTPLIRNHIFQTPIGPRSIIEAFEEGDAVKLERAIAEWVTTKPEQALQTLLRWHAESETPENGERYWIEVELIGNLFESWANHNAKAALEAAIDLEDATIRTTAVRHVGTRIGKGTDQVSWLKQLATLEESKDRLAVMSAVIESWSESDSAQSAMDWLSFDSDSLAPDLIPSLERAAVKGLLDREPRSAAEWLISRATHESLSGHYTEVVSQWSALEPNACGKWLGQQPIDPSTDEARAKFTHSIFRTDPASAAQWARTISNPEIRQEATRTVLDHWQKIEPEAATAFADRLDEQLE